MTKTQQSKGYANAYALGVCVLLSACGGGGGGSEAGMGTGAGGAGLSATLSIFAPTQTLAAQLTQGQPSTGAASLGGATLNLPANSDGTFSVAAASGVPVTLLPSRHIADTRADQAWAQGWTGAGTKVAIIDDFGTLKETFRVNQKVQRTLSSSTWGTGVYEVDYRFDIKASHGDLVASIAGGIDTQWTLNLNSLSRTLLSCTSGSCAFAPNASAFGSDVFDATNAVVNYTQSTGVAKEAQVVKNHVGLGQFGDAPSTIRALRSHLDNAANFAAINLSIGSGQTQGVSFDQIVDSLSHDLLSRKSDAVIVVSVGNNEERNTIKVCGQADLNGCNSLAVALSVLPQTQESVIVAGATQGSAGAEKIADYSVRAGVLKERYLLAPGGSGLFAPSGGEIVGTSFAAPRITGAAALLRQKFPNLNGQQAASILLLTASKDINNDGRADFTGVSDIYGHGKLDLMRALSPVGSLSIK
jgi:subtilisin family serine protease